MKVLLVGIGNILLTDEAIGVRVVEKIEADFKPHSELEIIDGGTMGMDLLPFFEDKDKIILVDAIQSSKEPGEIVRIEGSDLSKFFSNKMSPHQIGLTDLLAMTNLEGGSSNHMVLYGVVPKLIQTGLELTPEIYKSLDKLVVKVVNELKSIGIELQSK